MQKFTAEVELTTNHAIKNEWKNNNIPIPMTAHFVTCGQKTWGKSGRDIFCQFSGLVNGTRLAPFFCLILMKKGQKTTRKAKKTTTIAYSLLYPCWFTNQNKNTQPKHFGARFVIVLLFVYIFSVFSSHLPTYPPVCPQMQHAPSANACKKTANPHFFFFDSKK